MRDNIASGVTPTPHPWGYKSLVTKLLKLMISHRPPATLHDRVVNAIAKQAISHVAYTNRDNHRTFCLVSGSQEVWPDVILCDQDNLLVQHVVEVETYESLTLTPLDRWRTIASAVRANGTLWLLVPEAAVQQTADLCRAHGIRARVASWSLGTGGVTVSWHQTRRPVRMAPAVAANSTE